MMYRCRSFVIACAICAAALSLTARRSAAATPQEVDEAIKKGKAYIYSQIQGNNWEVAPAPVLPKDGNGQERVMAWQWGGVTGTACYGLLACREGEQNPKLKAAIEWLKTANIHGNYAVAMRAQVWHFLKNEAERKQWSRRDRDILVNGLLKDKPRWGFYAYYTDARGKPQEGWYDRSVSQICVLGVWATEQAGQEVPLWYWETVDAAWKRAQRADGGWNYQDPNDTSGTMTAAGIATLYITQDFLLQSEMGRFSSCKGGQRNEWIERGLAWMDKNAPGLLVGGGGRYYYQMYGIERIGVASGRKYFGTTDWYAVGADQLVKLQNADGSWGTDDIIQNPRKIADTVFSLLFLVRGRAPIVMNKLEYTIAPEPGKKVSAYGNVPDPWNQRPRDAANFAEWSGNSIESYMNWQVVNLNVSASALHDSPILYIAGGTPLRFTPDELGKLRQFVEGGGLILGNADCANARFSQSFIEMGRQLFPKYEFRELPKTHPIFSSEQYKSTRWRNPPKVMGLSNGDREMMLLIPDADLGKSWQLRADHNKAEAFELMQDIFLYSTDKEGLQTRRPDYSVALDPAIKADKTLSVARVIAGDNPNPEPGGWRRLAAMLHNQNKSDLTFQDIKLGEGKLVGHQLAHFTGTTHFTLNDGQRAELKEYVQKGGTLLIDAAGGSSDFAESADQELAAAFGGTPGDFGEILSSSDPIFAAAGVKIDHFGYREYARNRFAGSLAAPRLRVLRVNGRPAVIYSREDLTAGMVGEPVDGIIGYSPGTAADIVQSIAAYVAGGGKATTRPAETRPAAATRPIATATPPLPQAPPPAQALPVPLPPPAAQPATPGK